jgi:hypothetical protein
MSQLKVAIVCGIGVLVLCGIAVAAALHDYTSHPEVTSNHMAPVTGAAAQARSSATSVTSTLPDAGTQAPAPVVTSAGQADVPPPPAVPLHPVAQAPSAQSAQDQATLRFLQDLQRHRRLPPVAPMQVP